MVAKFGSLEISNEGSNNSDHGSSATTSGWLNIFAAACLLFVGMGSPAGV